MIQTRTVNGSLTEIYVNGGGYLTQSAPTDRREFWTSKIMTAGDSVENYREATAAEKSQYEQGHQAGVEAPAQWLIDWWNQEFNPGPGLNYGRYNPDTNFFESGSVKDLTATAALKIRVACGDRLHMISGSQGVEIMRYSPSVPLLRAMTPVFLSPSTSINLGTAFFSQSSLEEVQIVPHVWNGQSRITNLNYAFQGCTNLRAITGQILLAAGATVNSAFHGCSALEEVNIRYLGTNLEIYHSPLLSAASLAFMVENATNTSAISIKVHADVFAKLNDADNANYHPILATATAKQISFVTP